MVLVCRNSTDTGFYHRLRPYPRVLLRRTACRFKDYGKTPIAWGVVMFCISHCQYGLEVHGGLYMESLYIWTGCTWESAVTYIRISRIIICGTLPLAHTHTHVSANTIPL